MRDLKKLDVFVELAVQQEYLNGDERLRCTNATEILPNLRRMMAFARWGKIPVVSCLDAFPERPTNNGHPIVVVASLHRAQPPFSLLPNRVTVASDNFLCVSLDVLQRFQQAIFIKEHRDPFTNPKLDRLLTEMPARRFVVFGMALDTSLRLLVLGLLRRNRRVALIQDACGYWNPQEAAMALRQLLVKGCELFTAPDFIRQHAVRYGRRRAVRLPDNRSVA